MARYQPKQTLEVTEPCHEDWDAMTGDARVRHCACCHRDVHNTAAMTPRQIEAMLAVDGPLPCMRLARFADGSLLVAEEMRAQPRFGALAGVAVAALVSLSAASAGAQSSSGAPILPGRRMPVQAMYSGMVVGEDGKPAAGAHVYVSRLVAGKQQRVEAVADGQGSFHLQAAPGDWRVGATGVNGPVFAAEQAVTLHSGQQTAAKPLVLDQISVTAGILLPPTARKAKPGR